MVDREASELLPPGVLPHRTVDVLADVLFFGLLRGLGLHMAGDVLPVAVTVPEIKNVSYEVLKVIETFV